MIFGIIFLKGFFKWIVGSKPRLNYESSVPYYRNEDEREMTAEDLKHIELTKGRVENWHKISEKEILFEAAEYCKDGKDLLYLVSSSGNKLGAKWLQSVLGDDYRVHSTSDIYRSNSYRLYCFMYKTRFSFI